MSQTSAGKIQARDRERGNPQQATSTVPYEEAQYGDRGSGPLPGRSADRSFADYASAAQQGESGTGTRPAEAGTFGRQHTVPGVGSPVPESAPTLEPLPPPGGSAPAAAGGFGMQPRLSAPATPTVLSAPTPQPALPSPLTSPSRHSAPAPAPATASPSSSAAPAASPQVRQATADSGAPQMRAQGVHPPPPRVGTAAQRPPGETHGAARADLYGPPRTVSYDRPAADGYGQVAIPSAPDDEITVLSAPVSVAEQVAAAGPPSAAVVKGRVQIEDEVVERVAGLAAVEVEGVADLGGSFARALEAIRDHVGVGNRRGTQGVRARIEDRQVAIHVVIVIEYGAVVMDVAKAVKANVARAVNHMLGLRVVEVNVTVDDVAMPQRARAATHPAQTPDIEQAPDTLA